MDGSFGSRLRSQREQQQVPLTLIAEQTKIKQSLLEGLERDDVSQWPTGIFRRSFVRAYAHAIGLEPDSVLREFLALYPDPVEEDIPAILAASRESQRPPTRLGCLISSAISAFPAVRAGARTRLARGLLIMDGDGAAPDVAHDAPAADSVRLMESDPVQRPELITVIADGSVDVADGDPGVPTDEVEADSRPIDRVDADLQPIDNVEADLRVGLRDAVDRSAPVSRQNFGNQPNRASNDVEHEISAIAGLCTRLAVALHPRDVAPVLEHAADVLQAVGLTLWMWDPATRTLKHVLAHGYSGDVVARLPRVRHDADNAIADAFRSAETRVVRSSGPATGALVVPIVAPAGCAGVLALEFQARGEERESVRALATILAAQLATLFGYAPLADAVSA